MCFSRANLKVKVYFSLAFLVAVSFQALLMGEVTLPPIFSDHAILQQGMIIPIWGKASPGESVTVFLGGHTAQTITSVEGKWRVMLPPNPANRNSYTLMVQGKNRLEIQDVIFGDVWLCAGDERMNFPLSDTRIGKDQEGEKTDQQLRFFLPYKKSNSPDVSGIGRWVVCTPQEAVNFSAVGYFFARDLRRSQGMPIGMIQCTSNRAQISAWISHDGLLSKPSLKSYSHGSLSSQCKQLAPSSLFNGMIEPLIPYAITAAIWYEGISSQEAHSLQYRLYFARLIHDWREKWREGPFPFFFVQPAGFGVETSPSIYDFEAENQNFPWLRESLASSLTLPNTGMAVAADLRIPDENSSSDMLSIGRRLALLARNRVYGENIVDSGPIYHSMKIEGGRVRVSFDSVGKGLTLGFAPFACVNNGDMFNAQLLGFALAGADEKWFPATGTIQGNEVLLSCDAVPHPQALRYNWEGLPKGNLYNKEGLPAPPFRTDSYQPKASIFQ